MRRPPRPLPHRKPRRPAATTEDARRILLRVQSMVASSILRGIPERHAVRRGLEELETRGLGDHAEAQPAIAWLRQRLAVLGVAVPQTPP